MKKIILGSFAAMSLMFAVNSQGAVVTSTPIDTTVQSAVCAPPAVQQCVRVPTAPYVVCFCGQP